MSRSFKKPVHKITPQIDKNFAHKKVRKKIKQELASNDPDLINLDMDTRDMGVEEWGTKVSLIVVKPDDEEAKKAQEDMKRK